MVDNLSSLAGVKVKVRKNKRYKDGLGSGGGVKVEVKKKNKGCNFFLEKIQVY